jgi:hypothetical protein
VAARRLIIVMLALLVGSTFVATLVPQQDSGSDETDDQSTATTTEVRSAPDPLSVRINAQEVPRRGRVIAAEPAQRLSLDIASAETDLVSIPALGLLEDVAAGAPAHFDLRIEEPGSYAVRLMEQARTVATIEVGIDDRAAGAGKRDKPKDRGGAQR